jgi:CheY-like chemotaxis protein
MDRQTVILIAEDDQGHFELIKRNLWRSYVDNEIIHFRDGQEILDFLFKNVKGPSVCDVNYVLLLDIRMPKVDGREVLRRMKEDDQLRNIPVYMLTTTSDESEVRRCYDLGCNFYIVKPVDYMHFMSAVDELGSFLSMEGIRVPGLCRGGGETR